MAELLDRLDVEGQVQAMAIKEAAKRGGYISRDTVYALGQYDPERQLKGFARPIKRIT